MLYPLKFKPVYKDYLWGGRTLVDYGRTLPENGPVAESWELSAHPNGVSIVQNGPLSGKTLPELLREYGPSLIGSLAEPRDLDKFPLLIKLIDARDRLSVQVHPGDDYAAMHAGGEYGKNEMWYVMAAAPGAQLIAGVRPGTTREQFARAIADDNCLDLLQTLPVKAGDVVNIPAGLVHAIGAGLLICEVQQNSDTTYRVYDYGRRDQSGQTRPLHIEPALDVINFEKTAPAAPLAGLLIRQPDQPDLIRRVLVMNRYLRTEHWTLQGICEPQPDQHRFTALTVLEGDGQIEWQTSAHGSWESLPLQAIETILVPAETNRWRLSGQLKLLLSTLPDFDSDLSDIAGSAGCDLAGSASREQLIAWLDGRIGLEPLP
ncbi:MAG: class I mannose-6-phosphate isomerase [Clostridia bacterium]|nr:class I mannose-6-phosphate isomerase [Eubacteriales bacterium]MDD3866504.1 class I mannose-6-phosphate isomerase [Eubacteriales bacterium]MDD4460717.1 class I mannose-6-phosphate isomerase [Eubacteriales bacterium]NCC47565.1 class I mannose-6-phosphate isomerase [Clostridia bacterium]